MTEVRLETWPETVRVQGNLLGYEQSTVGAKLGGRVDEVPVDLGSVVREGDALVLLDTSELDLLVRQAEAQLLQACAAIGLSPGDSEAELDREQAPPAVLERALLDEAKAAETRGQQLFARRAITDAELETLRAQRQAAEARYRSALNNVGQQIALIGVRRAELAVARQQLADAEVRAPFDGVVERRHVGPGEYGQAGSAVVTLVRVDTLRFRAGVPERSAAEIGPGQTVLIGVQGEPRPIEATVKRVSPAVDPSGRALWIEADVPNRDMRLRTGLFAEADVVTNPSMQALTVPASAVNEFAGIEKVWVVRDGEAQELAVRTRRRDAERVEILDGLSTGDHIVLRADDGQAGPVVAKLEPAGTGRAAHGGEDSGLSE